MKMKIKIKKKRKKKKARDLESILMRERNIDICIGREKES